MKTDIYTQLGKKNGIIELPESMFGIKWNADLVHQVVISMQANARAGTAHAKDRGEVAGGGKKPWKQKGTGRARHGSSRSPIWKGGGVTFGPQKEKYYTKKINKKMRVGALFTVLSKKLTDMEILFLDALKFNEPKTADAKKMMNILAGIKGFEALVTKKNNTMLVIIPEKDMNVKKSFANFANIRIVEMRNINPVDILKYKYLMIVEPENAIKQLEIRIK